MVELIWDGKYDEDGKRTAPLRVELPFQTVETVNESAQQRQLMLDMFNTGRDPEWRNRLIWGDKKYVLPSLLPEFAGKVDLIYIDPPFATGADFSYQVRIGSEAFTKEASIIEQKAYRDTWGDGLDTYLTWFYQTTVFLYELLAETGSMYVHLDYHVGHYCKVILDEVFGPNNLRNEIVWQRTHSHASTDRFGPIHDTLFYYSKSAELTYNDIRTDYRPEYLEEFFDQVDENGERYMRVPLTAKGTRNGETGLPFRGIDVTAKGLHWKYKVSKLEELDRQGKLHWPKKEGGVPRLKTYKEDLPGQPIQDLWTDIKNIHNTSSERLGYETQKPETLLERIIQVSSSANDLVLDCFCGSGTTAAVAEKLNRRWITCDLGRFAIHTTRKRLLGIEGYSWIHGKKGGRMVHVGAVDSPVVAGDVRQIAIEFRKLIGTGKDAPTTAGIDILGWDFALDMNETQKQIAQDAQLDVKFIRIPREVLEDKAVKQGDIKFFELAALSADVRVVKRDVIISLNDFMVSRDDVPHEIIEAVNHWSEWIDYWAVDFNYRDDTFHNEWQSYRTRKDRSLQLTVTHPYTEAGTYTIVVKVIDILGNDTTKAFTVEVK